MRLDGKVAVVTGGASGIGQAMVRVFAEAGASVVAADLDDAALSAFDEESNVLPMRIDISRQADVDSVVRTAIDRFGQIVVFRGHEAAQTHAVVALQRPAKRLRISTQTDERIARSR